MAQSRSGDPTQSATPRGPGSCVARVRLENHKWYALHEDAQQPEKTLGEVPSLLNFHSTLSAPSP